MWRGSDGNFPGTELGWGKGGRETTLREIESYGDRVFYSILFYSNPAIYSNSFQPASVLSYPSCHCNPSLSSHFPSVYPFIFLLSQFPVEPSKLLNI